MCHTFLWPELALRLDALGPSPSEGVSASPPTAGPCRFRPQRPRQSARRHEASQAFSLCAAAASVADHAKIPPSVLIDYFSELEYIPFKASPKNLHIPFESRHALS